MIDAEFRSEERFSRLALAYEGESEKQQVSECIEKIIAKYQMKPETYTTKVSSGKEVLVIEYHDDNAREAGDIFEEMIKALNVKVCN
jgi:endo-alpha-1,4-polygalactosaminidase (GH114 family)